MVPSNVLQRVLSLRLKDATATGFAIEIDGQQYLITARHFLDASPEATIIDVFRNNSWISVPFKRLSVEPIQVDITVLALDRQVVPLMPVDSSGIKGTFLSQEVFFVGFPLGLMIDGRELNNGFPLPLVKHGILSYFGFTDGDPFLIDGINNPGFSGSPVVQCDNPNFPKIIGVISGYRFNQEPVFKNNQQDTELSVRTNTGLIIGYDLEYAIRAIKKNPIGFKIESGH